MRDQHFQFCQTLHDKLKTDWCLRCWHEQFDHQHSEHQTFVLAEALYQIKFAVFPSNEMENGKTYRFQFLLVADYADLWQTIAAKEKEMNNNSRRSVFHGFGKLTLIGWWIGIGNPGWAACCGICGCSWWCGNCCDCCHIENKEILARGNLWLIYKCRLPFDVVAITFFSLDSHPIERCSLTHLFADWFVSDAPVEAVVDLDVMFRYCFACYCAADSPDGVLMNVFNCKDDQIFNSY